MPARRRQEGHAGPARRRRLRHGAAHGQGTGWPAPARCTRRCSRPSPTPPAACKGRRPLRCSGRAAGLRQGRNGAQARVEIVPEEEGLPHRPPLSGTPWRWYWRAGVTHTQAGLDGAVPGTPPLCHRGPEQAAWPPRHRCESGRLDPMCFLPLDFLLESDISVWYEWRVVLAWLRAYKINFRALTEQCIGESVKILTNTNQTVRIEFIF